MSSVPTVTAAAAAAILTTKHANDDIRDELGEQRYFVHPHVAILKPNEPALSSYLEDIYSSDRKAPVDVAAPEGNNGAVFKALAEPGTIGVATAAVAAQLQAAMEPKSAKPGILFGFALDLGDDRQGWGVIKADLEDDQRFFLALGNNDTWSLGQVQDILPPPQTKYAKYAISPRPRSAGAVGIRDTQADPDSAADYFLQAVGLIVPRRSGTRRAVALAAKRAGRDDNYIKETLTKLQVDTAIDEVVDTYFAEDAEEMKKALAGTPERPMPTMVTDDPFRTKYSARKPRFELLVDESVTVEISGRTVTVTLPPGDPIQQTYVR